jgi:hypothetical protein
MYYAAEQFNLEREVSKAFSRYRHFIRDAPESWINTMMGQYIVHRIFQDGGLINRIINHRALSHLDEEEMAFLRKNQATPWRFSFSEIIANPGPDFYEMEDVFSGDSFLLYSPGISKVLQESDPLLWFNLISYNGACWETYGVINSFQSFEPEDILFYASQLNPKKWIESPDQLIELVSKDPIPYMLLFLKSHLPLVFKGDDQFVRLIGEFLDDSFDTSALNDAFTVEYAHDIYRLSLKDWSEFPHFSTAYYDEKEQLLCLTAMTDRGYDNLVDVFNDCGYKLPYNPDLRVNMAMLNTVQEILRKKIKLNHYETLFEVTRPDDETVQIDNLNKMLAAILPDLNAGIKPDIKNLAQQYNVDEDSARELINQLWEKHGKP